MIYHRPTGQGSRSYGKKTRNIQITSVLYLDELEAGAELHGQQMIGHSIMLCIFLAF